MEVDAARTGLTMCETRVQSAAEAEHAARRLIADEIASAGNLDGNDRDVEALMRWLPLGKSALADCVLRLERSEQEASQARARLSLARAALDAVDKLLALKTEAATQEWLRKEQLALDEAGRRRCPLGLAPDS